jgi:hypothetical protein
MVPPVSHFLDKESLRAGIPSNVQPPHRLVASAKQRNKEQYRNRNAEQPKEYVADSSSLFVYPAISQSIQPVFHSETLKY